MDVRRDSFPSLNAAGLRHSFDPPPTSPIIAYSPSTKRISVNGYTFDEDDYTSALFANENAVTAPATPAPRDQAADWQPIGADGFGKYIANIHNPGLLTEFGRGFGIGVQGSKYIAGRGLQFFGAEDTGQGLVDSAVHELHKAQPVNRRASDIDSFDGGVHWFVNAFGQGIPFILESVAAAAALTAGAPVALTGAGVAAASAGGRIAGLFGRKKFRDQVVKAADKYRAGKPLTRSENYLLKGTAALTAAAGNEVLIGIGDSYGELRDAGVPVDDVSARLTAAMSSVPYAALSVTPMFLLGRKVFPGPAGKTDGGLARRVGKGVGLGALAEGATEAGQEGLLLGGVALEPDATSDADDNELLRLFDAFAAGAAVGGPLGGLTGLRNNDPADLLQGDYDEAVIRASVDSNARVSGRDAGRQDQAAWRDAVDAARNEAAEEARNAYATQKEWEERNANLQPGLGLDYQPLAAGLEPRPLSNIPDEHYAAQDTISRQLPPPDGVIYGGYEPDPPSHPDRFGDQEIPGVVVPDTTSYGFGAGQGSVVPPSDTTLQQGPTATPQPTATPRPTTPSVAPQQGTDKVPKAPKLSGIRVASQDPDWVKGDDELRQIFVDVDGKPFTVGSIRRGAIDEDGTYSDWYADEALELAVPSLAKAPTLGKDVRASARQVKEAIIANWSSVVARARTEREQGDVDVQAGIDAAQTAAAAEADAHWGEIQAQLEALEADLQTKIEQYNSWYTKTVFPFFESGGSTVTEDANEASESALGGTIEDLKAEIATEFTVALAAVDQRTLSDRRMDEVRNYVLGKISAIATARRDVQRVVDAAGPQTDAERTAEFRKEVDASLQRPSEYSVVYEKMGNEWRMWSSLQSRKDRPEVPDGYIYTPDSEINNKAGLEARGLKGWRPNAFAVAVHAAGRAGKDRISMRNSEVSAVRFADSVFREMERRASRSGATTTASATTSATATTADADTSTTPPKKHSAAEEIKSYNFGPRSRGSVKGPPFSYKEFPLVIERTSKELWAVWKDEAAYNANPVAQQGFIKHVPHDRRHQWRWTISDEGLSDSGSDNVRVQTYQQAVRGINDAMSGDRDGTSRKDTPTREEIIKQKSKARSSAGDRDGGPDKLPKVANYYALKNKGHTDYYWKSSPKIEHYDAALRGEINADVDAWVTKSVDPGWEWHVSAPQTTGRADTRAKARRELEKSLRETGKKKVTGKPDAAVQEQSASTTSTGAQPAGVRATAQRDTASGVGATAGAHRADASASPQSTQGAETSSQAQPETTAVPKDQRSKTPTLKPADAFKDREEAIRIMQDSNTPWHTAVQFFKVLSDDWAEHNELSNAMRSIPVAARSLASMGNADIVVELAKHPDEFITLADALVDVMLTQNATYTVATKDSYISPKKAQSRHDVVIDAVKRFVDAEFPVYVLRESFKASVMFPNRDGKLVFKEMTDNRSKVSGKAPRQTGIARLADALPAAEGGGKTVLDGLRALYIAGGFTIHSPSEATRTLKDNADKAAAEVSKKLRSEREVAAHARVISAMVGDQLTAEQKLSRNRLASANAAAAALSNRYETGKITEKQFNKEHNALLRAYPVLETFVPRNKVSGSDLIKNQQRNERRLAGLSHPVNPEDAVVHDPDKLAKRRAEKQKRKEEKKSLSQKEIDAAAIARFDEDHPESASLSRKAKLQIIDMERDVGGISSDPNTISLEGMYGHESYDPNDLGNTYARAALEGKLADTDKPGRMSTGMPHGRVRLEARKFVNRLRVKPDLAVYKSVDDFKTKDPNEYRRFQATLERDGTTAAQVAGYHRNGKVVVISDHIKNPHHLKFVLAHETLGHFGLRSLLPQQKLRQLLNEAYKADGHLRAVADRLVAIHSLDKHVAIEEALSDQAAYAETHIWKRIWDAIKNALNRLGLRFEDDLSRYLLSLSRRYVRTGIKPTSSAVSPQSVAGEFKDLNNDALYGQFSAETDRADLGERAINAMGLQKLHSRFSEMQDEGWRQWARDLVKDHEGGVGNLFKRVVENVQTMNGNAHRNEGLQQLFGTVVDMMNLARYYAQQVSQFTHFTNAANVGWANKMLPKGHRFEGATNTDKLKGGELLTAIAFLHHDLKVDVSKMPPLIDVDYDNLTVSRNQEAIDAAREQVAITPEMIREGIKYRGVGGQIHTYKNENITKDSPEYRVYKEMTDAIVESTLLRLESHHRGWIDRFGRVQRNFAEFIGLDENFSPEQVEKIKGLFEELSKHYREFVMNDIKEDNDGVQLNNKSLTKGDALIRTVNRSLQRKPGSKKLEDWEENKPDEGVENLQDPEVKKLIQTIREIRQMRHGSLKGLSDKQAYKLTNLVRDLFNIEYQARGEDYFAKRTILTSYVPFGREGQYQVRVQAYTPRGQRVRLHSSYATSIPYYQTHTRAQANQLKREVSDLFGNKNFTILDEKGDEVVVRFRAERSEVNQNPPINAKINYNDFINLLQSMEVKLDHEDRKKLLLGLTAAHNKARKTLRRVGVPGWNKDVVKLAHQHVETAVNAAARNVYRHRFDEIMSDDSLWYGSRRVLNNKIKEAERQAKYGNAASAHRAQAELDDYNWKYYNSAPANAEDLVKIKGKDVETLGKGDRYREQAQAFIEFLSSSRNIAASTEDVLSSKWGSRIKLAVVLFYLGMSLAIGIINLTAFGNAIAAMSTYNPKNGFGGGHGFGRSSGALYLATRQLGHWRYGDPEFLRKIVDDKSWKEHRIKKDEAEFLAKISEQGILAPAQWSAFLGSQRGGVTNNVAAQAIRVWMLPFTYTEQLVRRSVALAEYRLSRDRALGAGLSETEAFAEAAREANEIILNSQGEFSMANRPAFFRSPIMALVYVFKTFPIMMTELWFRLDIKGKAALATWLFMMAGISGLFFGEDLTDLVSTFAEKTNLYKTLGWSNADVEYQVARLINDLVPGAAPWVMKGMLDQFFNLSLSTRLGLGNMIPGTSLFRAGASTTRELTEVIGPAFSSAIGVFQTASQLTRYAGEAVGIHPDTTTLRSIARNVPVSSIRSIADTISYLSDGQITNSQGKLITKEGVYAGAIARLLGFYPAVATKQNDLIRALKMTAAHIQEQRQYFVRAYVDARMRGDHTEARRVLADVRRWNRSNAGTPFVMRNFHSSAQRAYRENTRSTIQRYAKRSPQAIRNELKHGLRVMGIDDAPGFWD